MNKRPFQKKKVLRMASISTSSWLPHYQKNYLSTTAFLGSSPLQAAVSCQEIKDSSLGLAPDGRYWLFSQGYGSKSVEVYCDMERAGESAVVKILLV